MKNQVLYLGRIKLKAISNFSRQMKIVDQKRKCLMKEVEEVKELLPEVQVEEEVERREY